jgi:hypothetical protein
MIFTLRLNYTGGATPVRGALATMVEIAALIEERGRIGKLPTKLAGLTTDENGRPIGSWGFTVELGRRRASAAEETT